MTITGRIEELEILSNVYESKHAEFLAVYGRRRVGKTFLIREFFQNKSDALFFNVTSLKDGKMAEQIANVMDRIGETFYGGARLEKTNNWRDTFKALKSTTATVTANTASSVEVALLGEYLRVDFTNGGTVANDVNMWLLLIPRDLAGV